MSLPAQLLKEVEAAAMEYYPSDRHFMAGVQWLFTRLSEMSEGEFDENLIALEAGLNTVDIKELHDTSCPALFEYAKRIARHQHALSQAALLKAKEEIERLEYNLSCLLDHATGGLLSKKAVDDYVERQLDKERARCERMEKRLREALHGEFDAYDTGFNGSADEYIEREVSQALSGDE